MNDVGSGSLEEMDELLENVLHGRSRTQGDGWWQKFGGLKSLPLEGEERLGIP